MSIVKVQSVTGNGATLVLNSVVAGNALIYISSYYRLTSTGVAEATPTDSNGTFLASSADAPAIISGQDTGASIFHEQNAAAGTHTVTPQANTTHKCSLTEFSGLLASGMFDVAKSANSVAGNQTSQVTGTTLATAQADELEIISLVIVQGAGGNPIGLTDPVAGTTTLRIDQNTSTDIGGQQAFKVLVSAGTKSETFNWTTVDSTTGSFGCIATFKAATNSTTDNTQLPILGRGGRGPGRGPAMRRMAPQTFPTPAPVDTVTPAQTLTPFRIGRAGTSGVPTRRMIQQQAPDTIPFVQDGSAVKTPFRIGRGGGIGSPTRRMFPQRYADSSGSTTALLPTEGSITIAGVAASITLIIAAVSGAITITGNAPSINTILQASEGSIVISGNTASTTSILAPTVEAIVISGNAPSFTQTLVGVTGVVTIGGNTPSQTSILAATEDAVVIGGNAPSLVVSSGLSPTEGVIAISGNAPDLISALAITEGALTVSGNTPSIIGAGSAVEQASNWQSGHQWKHRTKKERKDEEDRQRIELGILPPELEAVAEQAVSDAVSASTELAAGRVEPQNAIAVAMQAREEYDSAYKQAYKGAYIAEVVAELWKQDVKRAQRRRAVALLLLH